MYGTHLVHISMVSYSQKFMGSLKNVSSFLEILAYKELQAFIWLKNSYHNFEAFSEILEISCCDTYCMCQRSVLYCCTVRTCKIETTKNSG